MDGGRVLLGLHDLPADRGPGNQRGAAVFRLHLRFGLFDQGVGRARPDLIKFHLTAQKRSLNASLNANDAGLHLDRSDPAGCKHRGCANAK